MNSPYGTSSRPVLHSVAVQSADFERAFRFYTEVLALPVLREPYDFKGKRTLCWLDGGAALIELYSVKTGVQGRSWNETTLGTVNLAFQVADLDLTIQRIRMLGVRILREPFIPPTGDPLQPRCAFIEGPDGEEVLLREPASSGAKVR